jgi:RNA polymerase sigma-B factor
VRDRRRLEPSPTLARADAELLRRYREGDEAARREVFARFLPLVRRLARGYVRPGESFDDLFQAASVGLVKALDCYDPERGTAFSTYAVPTIVGELKRYRRDLGWALHVPRRLQERILRIEGAITELSRDLGRAPTLGQLASQIGASVDEVIDALEASRATRTLSLEAPRDSGEDSAGTYADSVGAIDRRYETVELAAALAPVIEAMPTRDRVILRLRFDEDLTQREIARRLGISQMHVSRIMRRALRRLRAPTAVLTGRAIPEDTESGSDRIESP